MITDTSVCGWVETSHAGRKLRGEGQAWGRGFITRHVNKSPSNCICKSNTGEERAGLEELISKSSASE